MVQTIRKAATALATVGALMAAAPANAASPNERQTRPAATEAEKMQSVEDVQVEICRSIVKMIEQKGLPENADCRNILAVRANKSDKKGMKTYCTDKRSGLDVCEIARTTAEAMSKTLPQRVDTQSALTSATAHGRSLSLTYTYSIMGSQVRGFASSMWQSKPDSNEALSAKMRGRLCANPGMASLISAGLQIQTIYVSSDNKVIGSADVSRC